MSPTPSTSQTFAHFLRQHRIASGKSMGQLARELGITIVYYSEVEAGRKAAFPHRKVDYSLLASALAVPEEEIDRMAEQDRENRQMLKVFECDLGTADLAVAFGRRLSRKNLSPKQIEKIRRILNEEEA